MRTNFANARITRVETGFTLAEVVIASGLSVLLGSAIICTHILGLRIVQAADAKLGSNDDARKAVLTITDEIRSATRIAVGQGGLTNFTEIVTNTETGPAIQIYPSSDTNTWIRYYCENDPSSTNYGRLCRLASSDAANYTVVIPHDILNLQTLFSSEDSYGNMLMNNQDNRVIGLNLQLYTIENTLAQSNSAANHDLYQLRTRITRRHL
jgi:hypothetical protein